ncbi:hypothetical protein NMY22_g3401 [Coprinellus aureogranulatus]|nr:hypothetical protein NMY22_g3401 [Coprinellus aureogranulatus]
MSSFSTPLIQEANINNVAGHFFDQRHVHNVNLDLSGGPLERLERHVSRGAAHDSAERGSDTPKCDPKTRVAVQQDILSWIRYGHQDSDPTDILWLSGPAGAGKTAIMGSIADACHSNGWLSASFFFSAFASSSPDRRWKKYLIPTLAYHLIQRKTIPHLKDGILAAIAANPSVFDKTLEQQMDILILQPLAVLDAGGKCGELPEVVIIDGLDECDADPDRTFDTEQERRRSRDQQPEGIYLAVLARASRFTYFPFRIVIASRPEHVIQDFFSAYTNRATHIFLDDKYDPDSDIARYLEAKFNEIRRKFNLPRSWASDEVIRQLVVNASGQFIYASTATSPDPPLAALWLRAIDHSLYNHGFLKGLFESYPGETETLLKGLGSLVGLQYDGPRHDPFQLIFYHKSFLDFLKDEGRSESLYRSDESAKKFIKDRFYQVLKNKGSQSAGPEDDEFIEDVCNLLEDNFDPHRKYGPDDVAWWIANAVRNKERRIQIMFLNVHTKNDVFKSCF